MRMRPTSVLLVMNRAQELIGVVSLSDMTNTLISDKGEKPIPLMRNASCENIHKVLQGELLYECDAYRANGRIHMLCSHNKKHSDINYWDNIVVVNDGLRLQKRALSDEAGYMILVDMDIISQGIIRMTKGANYTIIKTPLSMFQVVHGIYRSPSVRLVMKRKTISLNSCVYIDDVYKQISKSRFRSYPIVNNQDVMLGSISRYHLLNYRKRKFVLVDHNEPSQDADDLREAEILGVVDHHCIGNVKTTTSIRFRNEIIDSMVSIIARMYKGAGPTPEIKTAAIMCCVIVSDTANFNSPTATPVDKKLAEELATIAEIELDTMTKEMLGTVATTKGRTMSGILYNDLREYNIDGKRIIIGQINIVDEQEAVGVQDEIRTYTEEVNEINKFDLFVMCFMAAGGSGGNLVFIGTLSYLVDETFKEGIMNGLYFVGGVISRRKQVTLTLPKCLEGMQECERVSFWEGSSLFSL